MLCRLIRIGPRWIEAFFAFALLLTPDGPAWACRFGTYYVDAI